MCREALPKLLRVATPEEKRARVCVKVLENLFNQLGPAEFRMPARVARGH